MNIFVRNISDNQIMKRSIQMQWSGSAVVWTVIIVAMMTVLAMEGVVMWRSGEAVAGMVCCAITSAVEHKA